MNMFKKRIFLLALLLLTVLVSAGKQSPAYAAEESDFVIEDGVLIRYVGSDSAITIPSNVTMIGESAFRENDVIQSVIIPGNVIEIHAYAFANCPNLQSVVMKEGVETIDRGAFAMDRKLSKVTIPKTMVQLKEDNFRESPWLLDNRDQFLIVGDGVLIDYKGNASKVTLPPKVKVISSDAFFNHRDSLTQIVMNSGLKRICSSAFYGFSKLSKVTVPSTVSYIGEYAFTDTPWLKKSTKEFVTVGNGILLKYNGGKSKVTLPSSITCINNDAFKNNKKLEELVIGSKVTEIQEFAFYDCGKLKKVNLPSSITAIGNCAFGRTALTSVTLPASVNYLGEGVFEECTKLTKVTFSGTSKLSNTFNRCSALKTIELPKELLEIKMGAFNGCASLKTIQLPKTLSEIGVEAFYGCTGLSSITIPAKVTNIPIGAFEGCSSLVKVIFAGKVSSIEERAFSGCTKLEVFTLPSSVSSIGAYAFYQCTSLTKISLGSKITEIPYYSFHGCSLLETIEIANDKATIDTTALLGTKWLEQYPEDFLVRNGVLYLYKGKGGAITIPDTVNTIDRYTFYENTQITELTLPSSVSRIEDFAFSNCTNLKMVTLTDAVEYIGYYAFSQCSSLTTVNVKKTGVNKTGKGMIDGNAFSECRKLKKLSIPDGISRIGIWAFGNCRSLTEVLLPEGLKYLDSLAFDYCSGLSKVEFKGTLEEIGYRVFNETPFLNQSKEDLVALQNVLLKYQGKQKKLTIPSDYTIIAPEAFLGNKTLTQLTLPNEIKRIGSSAFEECTNLAMINMPASSFEVGPSAFENTQWLKKQKESFVILDNGTLIKYQGAEKTVRIPDTVTVIAPGAFCEVALDKVIIPGTVKNINAGTFIYSSIGELILEEGVEKLSAVALDETRVDIIDIPDSVTEIKGDIVVREEGTVRYVIVCSKGSAAYQYGMTASVEDVSYIRVRIR
jgi:hypothetical protein